MTTTGGAPTSEPGKSDPRLFVRRKEFPVQCIIDLIDFSPPSFYNPITTGRHKHGIVSFDYGQIADAVVVAVTRARKDERPARALHKASVDRVGREAAAHMFA